MADFNLEVLVGVRASIGDTDSCNYEYTDDRLLTLIIVASNIVNTDIAGSYTISLSNQTITPNPLDEEDYNFINLVILKTVCMLMQGEHMSYSKSDFRVTDGPSTVDLSNISKNIKVAADSACANYGRAVFLYNSGLGTSIITPNSGS